MAAPIDLCILYDADRINHEKKILTAFKLGYSAVAINYVTSDVSKVPKAATLKVSEGKVQQLGIRRELKQYTRITVEMTASTSFTRMLHPDIQEYDIIAVRPTSDKLMQLAAVTLDIDIISADFTRPLEFLFIHRWVKKASMRHVWFEMSYSPCIRDRTMRKSVIANSLDLTRVMRRSKNVIISSACEHPTELRSPKDVMNLGILLGLSEVEAKDAITVNARAVLVRAFSRRDLQKRVLKIDVIGAENMAAYSRQVYVDEPPLEEVLEEEVEYDDEEESDKEEGELDEFDTLIEAENVEMDPRPETESPEVGTEITETETDVTEAKTESTEVEAEPPEQATKRALEEPSGSDDTGAKKQKTEETNGS